jgi:hypothetical protein
MKLAPGWYREVGVVFLSKNIAIGDAQETLFDGRKKLQVSITFFWRHELFPIVIIPNVIILNPESGENPEHNIPEFFWES